MGSVISNGIINAAGRNATISLVTRDGNVRQNAITGMVLFLQYWFWYPMLNFLTLTLTPTNLIGLNQNLKVPKSFSVKLNTNPSKFKYPEFIKKKSDEKKGKVETAVLSTTAKVKARVERKKAEKGDVEMSDSATPAKQDAAAKEGDKPKEGAAAGDKDEEMKDEEKKDEEEEKKEEEDAKKKEEEEATEGSVKNPSRVLKE